MPKVNVNELLYQALETEIGGVLVYRTAIRCAVNEDLKHEWKNYLEQTEHHVESVTALMRTVGVDPATDTPVRQVCRHIAASLVQAMQMALAAGPPEAAQIVAAECVTQAETKDHLNWELLGLAAEQMEGPAAEAIMAAYEEVEEEEDEHLYHTTGWTRELWVASLGLPAVLPPPEEAKDVKTAIGAARAKQDREQML